MAHPSGIGAAFVDVALQSSRQERISAQIAMLQGDFAERRCMVEDTARAIIDLQTDVAALQASAAWCDTLSQAGQYGLDVDGRLCSWLWFGDGGGNFATTAMVYSVPELQKLIVCVDEYGDIDAADARKLQRKYARDELAVRFLSEKALRLEVVARWQRLDDACPGFVTSIKILKDQRVASARPQLHRTRATDIAAQLKACAASGLRDSTPAVGMHASPAHDAESLAEMVMTLSHLDALVATSQATR